MSLIRNNSRRQFLKTSGATLAATSLPVIGRAEKPAGETLVQQLYGTLTEDQRKTLCFPFEHKLRSKVDNNWHITKPHIADFCTPDQQDLIRAIFNGLHSEEYRKAVFNQVVHDSGRKGFGESSIAIFGEPGTGKFEFVITGRHCTRRCDGDSVEGIAFGGPIFYGHAADSFYEGPDHKGSAYWYQAKSANALYNALDGRQRKLALIDDVGPDERKTRTVMLKGKSEGIMGIPGSELSADQKGLLKQTLADLLAMFRKQDADEAQRLIEAGGYDKLHMAYFKQQDIGKDKVWDVWQVESPNMIWYFRGDPHVHAWLHIKDPAHV